jgi:hypothetical protein
MMKQGQGILSQLTQPEQSRHYTATTIHRLTHPIQVPWGEINPSLVHPLEEHLISLVQEVSQPLG